MNRGQTMREAIPRALARTEWDKALFGRDEAQYGWLTISVPACLGYPHSEYYLNTHLARPSTLGEKALWYARFWQS